jgi:hypothetical protein
MFIQDPNFSILTPKIVSRIFLVRHWQHFSNRFHDLKENVQLKLCPLRTVVLNKDIEPYLHKNIGTPNPIWEARKVKIRNIYFKKMACILRVLFGNPCLGTVVRIRPNVNPDGF